MRQIAITGGKGGTGKSTVAVLLALKLAREGKKVVLCDADVECPDDHLILGAELGDGKPIYQEYPKIDEKKCTRCGKCMEQCRFNALFQVKDNAPELIKNLCTGCGLCWGLCPVGAITVKEEPCGETYTAKARENLWLVTGLSLAGVEETGPIVRDAKVRAQELAREIKSDYLLVDTSPGTHCNVINALLDSDIAYVVTEPTPLGVHDSRLLLELLKVLEVPAELVLNKAGVASEKETEKMAKETGVKIKYKIPYSEELVKAYSQGKLDEIDLLE